MEYRENDLIRIARRYNNTKRNYLIVDPLQGKHIPVSPTAALDAMSALGKRVSARYPDAGLVIGFAETATAVSAAIAAEYPGCRFVTTTREPRYITDDAIYFSEEHSHAVTQVLNLNKQDLEGIDLSRIILADDEISTGKTMINMVDRLREKFPELENTEFIAASFINRTSYDDLRSLFEKNIKCEALVFPRGRDFISEADRYEVTAPSQGILSNQSYADTTLDSDIIIPAKCTDMELYISSCRKLAEEFIEKLSYKLHTQKKILILGTEEFMYPALCTGREIERRFPGHEIKFHANTRSPICISSAAGYPIKNGFAAESFYGKDRTAYIYNARFYDGIYVMTDAMDNTGNAMRYICGAFSKYGCTSYSLIHCNAAEDSK